MEVVLPQSTPQTLTIIPRYNSATVSVKIREENTDKTEVQSIPTTTYTDGYLSFDVAFDFREGNSYELEVSNADGLMWRGKAFATSQTPQDYKLNADLIQL